MTEVPEGPCFQISPTTLCQGTYSEKGGRGSSSSLSHSHAMDFLLVVIPPTFSLSS